MGDASMTLTPEAEGAGLFVATARKAKPAAALCYGLGAERSAMFPGWFGDFLLSAEEVRTALPRAEEALDLATTQRSEALSRITAWMTTMGDAPDFDAAELIDAPLQVLRFAAETGSGATHSAAGTDRGSRDRLLNARSVSAPIPRECVTSRGQRQSPFIRT